ncbi:hypothetical protein JCM11251_007726 [Rhodosporidiobolus azoricus]
MKRLFNKAKRQDSHRPDHNYEAGSPPTASTPSSELPASTAGGTPPPPASASPHSRPPSQPGMLGQQPHQQYQRQQQPYPHQQQISYGPDGQAYMMVPVPVAMAQQGGRGGMSGGGVGRNGGLPRPPRVQDVGNAIGWSCAMPSFDWGYVLALADHLSQNGDAKKKGPAEEAAKALRKEFKHATPTAQERAVKLTFLLARNSDTKFRREISSKKFLSAVEDLVKKPETDPKVKDMVFRVLSPLAYEYQDDPTLAPLSTLFAKLLPLLSTYPTTLDPSLPAFSPSGAPLEEDDPLLRPEGMLTSASSRSGHRGGSGGRSRDFPSNVEQMRDLGKRAVEGKGYARMLTEAVDSLEREGRIEEAEGDEIVQEFYHQTLSTQDFLSTNLEWASVQAEQSRTRSREEQNKPSGLGADGEWESVEARELAQVEAEGKTTEEEEIFARLLAASTEISDALNSYHRTLTSRTRAQQEDADLAAAFEASKKETHYDRFGEHGHQHAHDGQRQREWSHDYGEGGSGAASPSNGQEAGQPPVLGGYAIDEQAAPVERVDKGKGRQRTSLNPYASFMEETSRSPSPAAFSPTPGAPVPQSHPSNSADDPYGGLDAFAEGLSLHDRHDPLQNGYTNTTSQGGYIAPPAQQHQAHFSSSNPYATLSLSQNSAASPFDDPSSTGTEQSPLRPPVGTTESMFLREYVPEGPSEKALGKIRRVSVRENSTDAADQQHRLEEALREKYARNYEEEQERRKSPPQ